jgi:hypothetical protein
MDAEGKVGYAYQMEGSKGLLRLDRLMSVVTTDGRGKYAEPTSRGMVFSLTLTATTTNVAAGNIVAAAAAASTQFALWNPYGSGKNIELLKFGMGITSGSAPAGPLFHGIYIGVPTLASSTGTAYANFVGPAAASIARWMSSAAGAAMTGGPAVQVLRVADFSQTAGVMSEAATVKAIEYIDGDIVLPPGTGWAPLWSAQGTACLSAYSITWMEVPIPS